MAVKFQNVCPKLADITYLRFLCEQLYFVLGYRHGSFRIYVGNIYSSKSDGTQVSILIGIQDGGQDFKWLPPVCRVPCEQSREN